MKANRENDTLILIPETDLVASRIEALRDYFAGQLETHADAARVVLDVRGVDIVDSLGVNLIVGLYRQCAAASRPISVTGAGERFMKVASFFRLPAILTIEREET